MGQISTALSLPLIGAFIGWFTNYIAVKMLFHPRSERRLLFFSLQGVFPKRQREFARKLGELVALRLLSTGDLEQAMQAAARSPRVSEAIDSYVDEMIAARLPSAIPLLAMVLNPELVAKMKRTLQRELNALGESIVIELSRNAGDVLKVQETVESKVAAYSSDELEQMLQSIMRREFRFIEIIGGVLGFAIGLAQAGVLLWRV